MAPRKFTWRLLQSSDLKSYVSNFRRVHCPPETIHDIGYHKPKELAQVVKEFLAEG